MDSNELKLLYEKKYANYLEGFHAIACRVLSPYPEEYAKFQKHWADRDYYLAYIPYMEVKHQNNIVLSGEEDKINNEFYWLFVN